MVCLPISSMVIFHGELLNNQMVDIWWVTMLQAMINMDDWPELMTGWYFDDHPN